MTTIPTEKKKRHRLTQGDCDAARLLMERKQTLQEIGKIIGVDSSTVGKIRLAGYDLQTYLAQRRAMNKKTRENKRKKSPLNAYMEPEAEENDKQILQQLVREVAGGITKGVEQVAGQIQMDLPEQQTDNPEEDMRNYFLMRYDDNKQMKFQAALMDKLLKKLDQLIDVLQKGGEAHE